MTPAKTIEPPDEAMEHAEAILAELGASPLITELPARRPEAQPEEDDLLREMRALQTRAETSGSPLAADLARFAAGYGKLLRRFNKTLSISDRYQSQMMDLKLRLELTARTDLLTGLANRWEIMARLKAELARWERCARPFSILIADLDNFKTLNDTNGHLAGDRMLKAIAETLRTSIRSMDFCGRWGGEEFLILLPETDLEQACHVAEKLILAVRQTRVPWGDRELGTSMSIGVGTYRDGMRTDELVRLVDDALYEAKRRGRNCHVPVTFKETRNRKKRP